MVDTKRKEEILAVVDALESAWLKHPSLRLGQLIVIITNDWNGKNDAFHIPDDKMFTELKDVESGELFNRLREGKHDNR